MATNREVSETWVLATTRLALLSTKLPGKPENGRDPGTTEVAPKYDDGRTVRFSQGITGPQIDRDTSAPYLRQRACPVLAFYTDPDRAARTGYIADRAPGHGRGGFRID